MNVVVDVSRWQTFSLKSAVAQNPSVNGVIIKMSQGTFVDKTFTKKLSELRDIVGLDHIGVYHYLHENDIQAQVDNISRTWESSKLADGINSQGVQIYLDCEDTEATGAYLGAIKEASDGVYGRTGFVPVIYTSTGFAKQYHAGQPKDLQTWFADQYFWLAQYSSPPTPGVFGKPSFIPSANVKLHQFTDKYKLTVDGVDIGVDASVFCPPAYHA
jgi:GH25 family lysozyme M1 (1,4-beta-N-acetylmuramidase)